MGKQYLVPMFVVVTANSVDDADQKAASLQATAREHGFSLFQDELIRTHAAGNSSDAKEFHSILDVVPVSELAEPYKDLSPQPMVPMQTHLSPIKLVVIQPGAGTSAFSMESSFAGANRVLQELAQRRIPPGGDTTVEIRMQWENGMHYTTQMEVVQAKGKSVPNLEGAMRHAINTWLGRIPNPGWTDEQRNAFFRQIEENGFAQKLREIESNCQIGDV